MLKGGVPQEVAFAEALVQAQVKAQKGKLKLRMNLPSSSTSHNESKRFKVTCRG